jgi:adenine phosphoribosyltransferase
MKEKMDLKSKIRTVMDFPKPGIGFKDITTLLLDPMALVEAVKRMAGPFRKAGITKIVGIESRGFIFGMPMAFFLKVPFVPIRKPGKLPAPTEEESYQLEYGTDRIQIHRDAIAPGDRVLLVDDLLATGGTMSAAVSLIRKLEGLVAGVAFLIELDFLKGREKLQGVRIHSLIHYDGE